MPSQIFALCLFCFLWLFTGSVDAANLKKTIKKKEPTWGVAMSVDQLVPADLDLSGVTEFAVALSFHLPKRQSLRLIQPATKLYEVNQGDPEFLMEDMMLFYSATLSERFIFGKLNLQLGTTLPFSTVSQEQGLYSVSSLRLSSPRSFFVSRLTTDLQFHGKFYFKKYTTLQDGTPMNKFGIGIQPLMSLKIVKGLELVGTAIWTYSAKEEVLSPLAKGADGNGYYIEGFLNYQPLKVMAIRLGYRQSDSATKNGWTEVNLYDPATTLWFLGLDALF